ncbi:MAG: hypothetical protein Fur0022_22920 [Anaerolineales bacterium]
MMKKFRSLLTFMSLSLILAACSTVVNACGGPQQPVEEEISVAASLDNVFIIRANAARENLPANQQTVMTVNEGVDVDEGGRAILQFADLLTVEVLRDGELTVEALDIAEQNAAVTIFQNGGALLNDFNAEEAIEKRFTINTQFASITATGTQFLVVREPNSPLEWVLALDAAPQDLQVTSTDTGVTKDVQTTSVRWVAPIGDPSANIQADMANVQQWLTESQAGTNTENFGDIVWAPADVQADYSEIAAVAPTINPAPGIRYTYQGVDITLGSTGQYTAQDCNLDGIPDIAMVNGSLSMDFRNVLARVKALDVTVLVQAGTANLTVLDPARQPIQTQSALASPTQAQVLTTRDDVPYHYADLTLEEGCFLGFSLTPPTPSGQPDGPRAAVEQLEVAQHFVRIDIPADGSLVTAPLVVAGEASVPEFNERQLLLTIETLNGQAIQQTWVPVIGGEVGGAAGTFELALEVDYVLPAEVIVRVQNLWAGQVLAEDWAQITLNPEKTGAFRRPTENGEFYAPFISETIGTNSIVMDGDPTDWQNAMRTSGILPMPINNFVYDTACGAFNPYGIPSTDAKVDLAAQVMFAYDQNYLFVFYLVQDESYAPYKGRDNLLFLGDAPQLIIDTDLASDFDDSANSPDDLEFDFHPGFADASGDDVGAFYFLYAPRAALWNLSSVGVAGASPSRAADEVLMGTWWTPEGYGVEAAIPWSSLNYSGQPGGVFGVAASVSDNDEPDADVQQCMISSTPIRDFRNPTTWGTLFLMALP